MLKNAVWTLINPPIIVVSKTCKTHTHAFEAMKDFTANRDENLMRVWLLAASGCPYSGQVQGGTYSYANQSLLLGPTVGASDMAWTGATGRLLPPAIFKPPGNGMYALWSALVERPWWPCFKQQYSGLCKTLMHLGVYVDGAKLDLWVLKFAVVRAIMVWH